MPLLAIISSKVICSLIHSLYHRPSSTGGVYASYLLCDHDTHGYALSFSILHLGKISKDKLDVYKSGQVRCTINSMEDIEMLEEFGSKNCTSIRAHLKIDTGMGRMGVCNDELDKIIDKLSISNYLEIEGLYSHFATAEEKDTKYQMF